MAEDRLVQRLEQAGQFASLAKRAQETFWGLLGCEIIQADEHKVKIRLDAGKQHLNLLGIVHGGVIMSLIDNAMGLTAMLITANDNAVTANMNTHFLASSKGGVLYCEAELIHRTERTLTLQAQVKDENDRLLALGSGAYRLI